MDGAYATSATGRETSDARETRGLIASDKVEGTEVRNPDGEYLGTIDRVMIDKISGKVAYAVMSFGGFLGIGDRHHALPWSVLTYDTRLNSYVVALTKEQLEGAPTFDRSEDVDWEDRVWGQRLHDYYRAQPYWMI